MHACGHDIHMASILAIATKLKEEEEQLNGRVRFYFNPLKSLGMVLKSWLKPMH